MSMPSKAFALRHLQLWCEAHSVIYWEFNSKFISQKYSTHENHITNYVCPFQFPFGWTRNVVIILSNIGSIKHIKARTLWFNLDASKWLDQQNQIECYHLTFWWEWKWLYQNIWNGNNTQENLDRDRHPKADPERFHNFGKQLTIFLRQIGVRTKLCLFT